jgi:hypothetical protein
MTAQDSAHGTSELSLEPTGVDDLTYRVVRCLGKALRDVQAEVKLLQEDKAGHGTSFRFGVCE